MRVCVCVCVCRWDIFEWLRNPLENIKISPVARLKSSMLVSTQDFCSKQPRAPVRFPHPLIFSVALWSKAVALRFASTIGNELRLGRSFVFTGVLFSTRYAICRCRLSPFPQFLLLSRILANSGDLPLTILDLATHQPSVPLTYPLSSKQSRVCSACS